MCVYVCVCVCVYNVPFCMYMCFSLSFSSFNPLSLSLSLSSAFSFSLSLSLCDHLDLVFVLFFSCSSNDIAYGLPKGKSTQMAILLNRNFFRIFLRDKKGKSLRICQFACHVFKKARQSRLVDITATPTPRFVISKQKRNK